MLATSYVLAKSGRGLNLPVVGSSPGEGSIDCPAICTGRYPGRRRDSFEASVDDCWCQCSCAGRYNAGAGAAGRTDRICCRNGNCSRDGCCLSRRDGIEDSR